MVGSYNLPWKFGISHSLQPDGGGDVRQLLRLVGCIVGGDDGFIGGSIYLGCLGVKVVDMRMNFGKNEVSQMRSFVGDESEWAGRPMCESPST